jgi:hypothetical protein
MKLMLKFTVSVLLHCINIRWDPNLSWPDKPHPEMYKYTERMRECGVKLYYQHTLKVKPTFYSITFTNLKLDHQFNPDHRWVNLYIDFA